MTELVSKLAAQTGLSELDVRRIMSSAPVRYKVFTIPKRNGKLRVVAQPAREVKLLQRALVDVLLRDLPVHEAATAYRQGVSVAENARRHAGDGPILKMDFRDFFPSIRGQDWASYCRETGCLTEIEDIHLSTSLLFRRAKGSTVLRLAIGAPSSPILSNIIMREFDESITSEVSRDRVTYTRYADDLTFSAPRTGFLNGVMSSVARTVRSLRYPKLEINGDKTTYVTRKYHRIVTGITLANDGRTTIGWEKKREIRSKVYRASKGLLNQPEMQELSGYLAFINVAEPEYLQSLRVKYGESLIHEIQKAAAVPTTVGD